MLPYKNSNNKIPSLSYIHSFTNHNKENVQTTPTSTVTSILSTKRRQRANMLIKAIQAATPQTGHDAANGTLHGTRCKRSETTEHTFYREKFRRKNFTSVLRYGLDTAMCACSHRRGFIY